MLRSLLSSMAARVFLILAVGMSVAAACAFTAADLERRDAARRAHEERTVDRVADLVRLVARAPTADWSRLLDDPGPDAVRWGSAPSGRSADPRLTARLRARLGAEALNVTAYPSQGRDCRAAGAKPPRPVPGRVPPPPPSGARAPGRPPPAQGCAWIGVTLADGRSLALMVPSPPTPPRDARLLDPLFLLLIASAALGLAYGVAGLTTAPLRRLSMAASALGRDLESAPLRLEGPLEVQQAAAAFNRMQERLRRHMQERTHMLAAITHDLQTPLTRQRLRLEKVGDAELRDQLLSDHGAMQALVRDGLDLARSTAGTETLEPLDVDSLLQSLAEDAQEAGLRVTVTTASGATIAARPEALRRCVSNLLENGVKYAGEVELSSQLRGDAVVIEVRDHGPGIDPSQLAAVLEPFVRLEGSRSRDTGGVGLGLTIARLLAERSGARLAIRNAPGGGLEATVSTTPWRPGSGEAAGGGASHPARAP